MVRSSKVVIMRSKFIYLSSLHFLNDGFSASLFLLLPFLAGDLKINLTEVGFLGTGLNLLSVAMALPAGFLASRIGNYKTIFLGLVFYALGFLATSLAPVYFFVFCAFLLAGIGFGLFHPIAFALVAKWSEQGALGKHMGTFTAMGDFGRITVSAGLTFLVVMIGWRAVGLIYGLLALILGLVVFVLLSKNYEIFSPSVKKSVGLSEIKQLVKNRKFLWANLAKFFDGISSSSLVVFLAFLLLARGVAPAFLGFFSGAYFFGNLTGKFFLGRLADNRGNFKTFVLAEIFMASAILLLTLLYNNVLLLIISYLLGVFSKGTVPVIQTFIADSIKDEDLHAQGFGMGSMVGSAASAIGPLILGFSADKWGINTTFYVSAIFAILAILPSIVFFKTKHMVVIKELGE